MGVEIEKKYKLTAAQRDALAEVLRDAPEVVSRGEDSEENTLFAGPQLDLHKSVLRLRVTGGKAVLTYKERDARDAASGVRRQREDETEVSDAAEMRAILDALGYRPSLVYEKRRATWEVGGVELVIDELPFGAYAELEGEEEAILAAEKLLGLDQVAAEALTYPELAAAHGVRNGEMIEARF